MLVQNHPVWDHLCKLLCNHYFALDTQKMITYESFLTGLLDATSTN
jgi:hypothetical protein